MIVNLDKFKSIIIQKTNQTIKPKTVFNKKRRCKNRIDGQLNLNLHISNICKSVSKQLNAFVRLKCFLAFEERNVLINSLVLSSFNYCPLVWFISWGNALLKVENLQICFCVIITVVCTKNY